MQCFTWTLWDLTRCMLSAGVLGRIFPHPSTVQRMLVRTSLVSSVMEGLIISLSCKGSFSLHFCLLWRVLLLTVAAAMIQHTTTHFHFRDTLHSNELTSDSPLIYFRTTYKCPHQRARSLPSRHANIALTTQIVNCVILFFFISMKPLFSYKRSMTALSGSL